MTVEEIFTKLASHMVEGIMIHDAMAQAYDFLGFKGYKACHDYHHVDETSHYLRLIHYYMDTYHKLLKVDNIPQPDLIPATWYKYSRAEVDVNTKRTAVKDLIKKWVTWEQDTKKLLETSYQELSNIGEIAAAIHIKYYIMDVAKELHKAEYKHMELETINYDIGKIMGEQKKLYHKYKECLECIFPDNK